jgi:hypothetical protein
MWRGELRLEGHDRMQVLGSGEHTVGAGPMTLTSMGWSPFKAIKGLAKLARGVLNSPLLRMVIPPQVALAIKSFQLLAKVAKSAPLVRKLLPRLSRAARSSLIKMHAHAQREPRRAPPARLPQRRAAPPPRPPPTREERRDEPETEAQAEEEG